MASDVSQAYLAQTRTLVSGAYHVIKKGDSTQPFRGETLAACLFDATHPMTSTTRSRLPLHELPGRSAAALDLLPGVKVLDLTSSIAGPYAGQLLADPGATVVKVERPATGDDARAWGPPFLYGESLWFMSVNRGKQSITLDFSVPEGRELLHKLVAQCDVVLLNLVARAQRKLGLDWARLRVLNPRLIHVSVTGFGLRGGRADLPCYDLIAEGYSGVMDLTGETDAPPQKVPACRRVPSAMLFDVIGLGTSAAMPACSHSRIS